MPIFCPQHEHAVTGLRKRHLRMVCVFSLVYGQNEVIIRMAALLCPKVEKLARNLSARFNFTFKRRERRAPFFPVEVEVTKLKFKKLGTPHVVSCEMEACRAEVEAGQRFRI